MVILWDFRTIVALSFQGWWLCFVRPSPALSLSLSSVGMSQLLQCLASCKLLRCLLPSCITVAVMVWLCWYLNLSDHCFLWKFEELLLCRSQFVKRKRAYASNGDLSAPFLFVIIVSSRSFLTYWFNALLGMLFLVSGNLAMFSTPRSSPLLCWPSSVCPMDWKLQIQVAVGLDTLTQFCVNLPEGTSHSMPKPGELRLLSLGSHGRAGWHSVRTSTPILLKSGIFPSF